MVIKKIQEFRIARKKEKLLNMLEEDPRIAVVGRVYDWLKNPESRYPISCTMLAVKDSMEGQEGIEYSWTYVSKALRFAAGCAVDLTQLRPKGTDNGRGLVSSGAASFATIYSKLNEVLRRGGTFKNGAVVAYLDALHPDFEEFISADLGEWVKRAVYVSDDPASPDYILRHPEVCKKILQGVRQGTLWVAKKRWYNPTTKKTINFPPTVKIPGRRIVSEVENYEELYRLYSQVCLEILLPSRGTCILSHVNLGECTVSDLPDAFENAMEFLCQLHSISGAGKSNYYLPPSQDRQVGLGVIGLANFLAIHQISYKDFTDCLYDRLTGNETKLYDLGVWTVIDRLIEGFRRAGKVAKKYKMDRAFTIAPTASCSFRYTDMEGYTTTPEISPPICHPVTKKTVRDSSTFGQKEYQYNIKVETAQQVGWETYYKLVKAWQLLMDLDGLAHSISFNIWDQCAVDMGWFTDWVKSPIVTTYYRMLVGQGYADKSSINIDGIEVAEEGDNFFMPVENTDTLVVKEATSTAKIWFDTVDEEEEIPEDKFCPLNPNPGDDCSACSE